MEPLVLPFYDVKLCVQSLRGAHLLPSLKQSSFISNLVTECGVNLLNVDSERIGKMDYIYWYPLYLSFDVSNSVVIIRDGSQINQCPSV